MTIAQALTGEYIEAGPAVICAVWVFLGVTFFLYIKARKGPGPFLIPSVFGAITIDISFITAVLIPYPYYTIGQVIVLPLVFHCAFCILASATIFPSTITAQYAAALARTLEPLESALREHRAALQMSSGIPDFAATVGKIAGLVSKAEGGLGPAAASHRLIKNDIIFGRFAPSDVGSMHEFGRRLVVRANGLGIFFTLIDPTRERFPVTPLPSKPNTPVMTPVSSRRQSFSRPSTPAPASPDPRSDPESVAWGRSPPASRPASPTFGAVEIKDRGRLRHRATRERKNPSGSMSSLRTTLSRHLHIGPNRHEDDSQNQRLHFSLLHLAHSLSVPHANLPHSESTVAVFESQRYLALEATRLSHPDSPEATETFVFLLGESCEGLLSACADAVREARGWISGVRSGWLESKHTAEQRRVEQLAKMADVRYKVDSALQQFRKYQR